MRTCASASAPPKFGEKEGSLGTVCRQSWPPHRREHLSSSTTGTTRSPVSTRCGLLASVIGLAFLGQPSLGQDGYVVLDRATDRGLFLVDPAGAITAITPTVPWQHAHSLVRDALGNFIVTVDVYAALGQNDGVYRASPAGEISAVAVGEQFAEPSGVAIDALGNYVVLNRTPEGRPQILRINPAGQMELLFEGRPLYVPIDIAIDHQGAYVITDRASAGRLFGAWTYLPENGAVYRFDPLTRQMTTVRSSVDENSNVKFDDLMGHLTGVVVDADGNYVVLEAPPHLDEQGHWEIPIGDTYLLRMRPDGEVFQTIHIPALDDYYCIGLDIAIDSQGDYIVADALGISNDKGRLFRVTPTGQVTTLLLTPLLGEPGGVVVLAVPPPPPPQIVGMSLVSGADPARIRFSWKSELGWRYRIQRASSLRGDAWQDMALPLSGTGAVIEFSDQCVGREPRFYRIRLSK